MTLQDMDTNEWIILNVVPSEPLISYIRDVLLDYKSNPNGVIHPQPVTNRFIARVIHDTPEILGSVSEETIRRFLNASQSQKPSIATLRTITHFLLLEEKTTRRDLRHRIGPVNPPFARKLDKQTVMLVIHTAHWALQMLESPEGMAEENEKLFFDVVRDVSSIYQRLDAINEKDIQSEITKSLPLWKQAWKTFVLGAAGAAGTGVVFAAGYSAGFTAGMLYHSCAEGGLEQVV